MLEDCKNAQERWGGVHQLIDRWLAERRALLTNFRELQELATPISKLEQGTHRCLQRAVDGLHQCRPL